MDTDRVILDKHGRILIPSALRKKMGWEDGQPLTILSGEYGLRILSRVQALEQAQEQVRKYARPGISVVDELLRERREEVRRDDGQYERSKTRRSRRRVAEKNVA
jgi:bifunctional DNA-binding transcriptional regulator/antitoxin component of YhaV-PrlF toxin-antitoxin module